MVVLVATRKGAWLYHGDAARRSWRVEGPHFLGHIISHVVLDPRDGRTLLAAAKTGHLGPTIFRSTDLGRSWKEAARPPAFAKAPEGEKGRVFDLAIGLDREYPMQTALGLATPVPVVAVDRGPPHVGATGWLFHLDAPNVSLLSLRPAGPGLDAVVARLLETGGQTNQAAWRCVRDPVRSALLDAPSADGPWPPHPRAPRTRPPKKRSNGSLAGQRGPASNIGFPAKLACSLVHGPLVQGPPELVGLPARYALTSPDQEPSPAREDSEPLQPRCGCSLFHFLASFGVFVAIRGGSGFALAVRGAAVADHRHNPHHCRSAIR